MSATPHDAFARAIFGQPEHAVSELQAVLPAKVLAQLDLGTLTALPGSFVDEELRQCHSDLLFSVRLRAGGRAFIYILLEHQSTTEEFLPLRMLTYEVRIWERWRREHPDARYLPPILPLVLYHGDGPWTAACHFSDLFGLSPTTLEALDRHVVQFEIQVDDLTELDDRELQRRATDAVATLALLALKHARRSRDLQARLLDWSGLFLEVLGAPGGAVAFRMIERYILEASPHVEVEFLSGTLASKLQPDAKEQIMTTGQQLLAQGRSEGRTDQLVIQLEHRFGKLPPALVARIETASVGQLDRWAIRVLDAKALTEVFAESS